MSKITKYVLGATMLSLSIPAAQAVDFGAFGDVSYQGSSENDTADSFVQGQFDLYATQKIDPNTKVFVEIVYEDGGSGYGLDLERLNITHKFNPGFSIGWGRFHTPIGYWNTAYHHGALIQDTVLRPTFLDFEDGKGAILPTHIIGLMAGGKVPVGGGDIDYDLMAGNSSSINTDTPGDTEIDVNNVADRHDQKMVAAKATYKLSQMPLEVGVFALHNPIADSGTNAGRDFISMMVMGGHFRYAANGLDVLGETYNFNNDDKITNTGKHKASAYYVQVGYRVTDKLKPIYRYENVDFLSADPYFATLGTPEGSRHVFDLRYDLDDTNALKFEIARFEPVNSAVNKSYTFYALQWAFLML